MMIAAMVFGTVNHALAAAVRVAATAGDQCPIAGGIEAGQLLHECDQIPEVLVAHVLAPGRHAGSLDTVLDTPEIGRASCRERVCKYVELTGVAGSLKKKK